MTMKLIPTYRFDKHGYYMGETRSMQDSATGLITMPRDCVSFPPGDEQLHWRISKDKTCWQRVKGVEELALDELVAYVKDETERNAMVRSRILNEASKDPRYQVLRDNERGVLYVVKRPSDSKLTALQALKKQYLEALDITVAKYSALHCEDDINQEDYLMVQECLQSLLSAKSVDDIVQAVNKSKLIAPLGEQQIGIINGAIEARTMALLVERKAAWQANGVQEFVESNMRYEQALTQVKEQHYGQRKTTAGQLALSLL